MNSILFIGVNLENNIFEVSDYKKLKSLQKKLNSWSNRWNDEYIEGRKGDLKSALQELENYFKKKPYRELLKRAKYFAVFEY